MTDQEINEAVGIKLGFSKTSYGWSGPKAILSVLPDYCHDIKAAWEIVEFLAKKNLTVDLTFEIYIKPRARVSIRSDGGGGTWHINVKCVQNESAPMAICLAFLKLP